MTSWITLIVLSQRAASMGASPLVEADAAAAELADVAGVAAAVAPPADAAAAAAAGLVHLRGLRCHN